MNAVFGHWLTTLFGFLAGVVNYFVLLGANLPTNGREWGAALLSALFAGLGVVAQATNVKK